MPRLLIFPKNGIWAVKVESNLKDGLLEKGVLFYNKKTLKLRNTATITKVSFSPPCVVSQL